MFLKNFSNILWRFLFAMSKVTYAHADGCERVILDQLWGDYAKDSWTILQEYRQIISASIYLVNDKRFDHLKDLYRILIMKDSDLTVKAEKLKLSQAEWTEYHLSLFYGFAEQLDSEIAALAHEMGLKVSNMPVTEHINS